MDDLQAAWSSLSLALLGAGTLAVTTLGAVGVSVFRSWQRSNEKRAELAERELELKRLEVEEKIRAKMRSSAMDAAAIAQETSLARTEPLSGRAKATLAADKLKELEPDLEGSRLNDLVKVGAAHLRAVGGTTFSLSQSMAPPPEKVNLPREPRLPAPAPLPRDAVTSRERKP